MIERKTCIHRYPLWLVGLSNTRLVDMNLKSNHIGGDTRVWRNLVSTCLWNHATITPRLQNMAPRLHDYKICFTSYAHQSFHIINVHVKIIPENHNEQKKMNLKHNWKSQLSNKSKCYLSIRRPFSSRP